MPGDSKLRGSIVVIYKFLGIILRSFVDLTDGTIVNLYHQICQSFHDHVTMICQEQRFGFYSHFIRLNIKFLLALTNFYDKKITSHTVYGTVQSTYNYDRVCTGF